MVPVTLLNVKPGDKVLDMCAAPGSKTIQLLEAINHGKDVDRVMQNGFVLANDTDAKRAYMLAHQAMRLNLPSLFVTQNDATKFPSIKNDKANFMYDKILCDVPCSGDGTLRKNNFLWRTFHCHMGH